MPKTNIFCRVTKEAPAREATNWIGIQGLNERIIMYHSLTNQQTHTQKTHTHTKFIQIQYNLILFEAQDILFV